MLQSALTILISLQLVQVPADEIRTALAHAEALYYGARFTDAIQLLERIDDLLESSPDRQEDKLATKLQLALAHVGINDTASARAFLAAVVNGTSGAPESRERSNHDRRASEGNLHWGVGRPNHRSPCRLQG